MKLISATIRNYRVHREQTVDFDPQRTLIRGPNESGKSTLAEAIHSALFLRAKVGGEALERMRSRHAGYPEVDLAFEAGGQRYELQKRFCGTKGTTILTLEGGQSWHAEAAEEKLSELLHVDAAVSGKGAAKQATQQWAHLWSWQGQAGEDPSAHANTQRDALIARLKSQGGAVVMQSDLDAKVASCFAVLQDQWFSKKDIPRAGSDLASATKAYAEAKQKLGEAEAVDQKLQKAVDDFEEATTGVTSCGANLEALDSGLRDTQLKLQAVAKLRLEEASQVAEARAAGERYELLAIADARIKTCRDGIESREKALAPKAQAVIGLGEVAASKKRQAEEAGRAYEEAAEAVRKLRQGHDLARAYVSLYKAAEEHSRISTRAAKVGKHKGELAEVEKDLAGLPVVDAAKVRNLQKLEGKHSNAEAALKAMAAGIEVIESVEPVIAGVNALRPGEALVLTDETEVKIGAGTRLILSPGGGTNLTEARAAVQDAQRELQKALEKTGIVSVLEASNISARRQGLEARKDQIDASLEGLGAVSIDTELSTAVLELESCKAELNRLSLPDHEVPADLDASNEQERTAGNQLRVGETAERAARLGRDEAILSQGAAETEFHDANAGLEKEKSAIADLKAQLSASLETYGDDVPRGEQLRSLLNLKTQAGTQVQTTQRALTELQPELLVSKEKSSKRAIETTRNQLGTWEKQLAVARSTLVSDGVTDPKGSLAEAKARARSAQDHLRTVERKGKAIQLLHNLFLEEQRALADQFTSPLAEKISSYLQVLFGPEARAVVRLQDNEFTGLEIARRAQGFGAFEFERLSGGTKEQVAAAVRLAMAEVLAQDHGGCLPLVFDDAFAYSDPDRVKTLQYMLDRAAERGLQIIVLTCNPDDYLHLGATSVRLSPVQAISQQEAIVAPDGNGGRPDKAG